MSMPETQNFKINQPPARGSEKSRPQSIIFLTIVVSVLSTLGMLGLFYMFVQQASLDLGVLIGLYASTAVTGFISQRYLFPRERYNAGLVSLSLVFGFTMLSTAALVSGLGFPCAIVYLIYSLMVSSLLTEEWKVNLAIGGGILISGLCALLTEFSPFEQLSINLIDILTPAILGILFMVYMAMLTMQFLTATLRIRLVTAFLAIVIIPLSLLSGIQSRFMFEVLNQEVRESLRIAAQQTTLGIDSFLEENLQSLTKVSQLDVLVNYLELSPDERSGRVEEFEMKSALNVLSKNEFDNSIYVSSYGVLDMDGNILYDTIYQNLSSNVDPETLVAMGLSTNSDQNEIDQDYFLVPARSGVPYISPLKVTKDLRSYFYNSSPIRNKAGETIGVLRVRYDGLMLQSLLSQYNRLLGDNSYAILLDENNIRLADGFTPAYLYKSVAPLPEETTRILQENQRMPLLPQSELSTDQFDFQKILNDYERNPFFSTEISDTNAENGRNELGAITRLKSMPWKVVYLQADFSNDLLRDEQRKLNTLVTTLVAVLVAFVAVLIAQFLSSPIKKLTLTAQKISEGNLEAQAPVGNTDEFGMLGSSFNLMTHQLRSLIGQLEDRVAARTQEIESTNETLSQRARQMQTISEVARQIVSSQELETFLSSITHLVSERFNFYHVGIFLLDERKEFAVLRAANSEGGQRMLARNHKLPVGKLGIVGRTTGTGEATIASDVGSDTVFFNNPDLPNTRSEIAVPLKVGGETIGALDIQSTEANAFHQDDIDLFNTLADQIAIAIYNNQLYTETLRALDEAQNLHRQYLRSEWVNETARRKVLGYVYNRSGIVAQHEENPLWEKVFTTGEPVYTVLPEVTEAADKSLMAVPITVRGETIGVIQVQEQGDGHIWSEDEMAVVNSVASQVGIALENARLFENTVRRAEREKKVSQITAKIRTTNDPEEMMRIAVSELQQALLATRAQIYVRQNEDKPGEGMG